MKPTRFEVHRNDGAFVRLVVTTTVMQDGTPFAKMREDELRKEFPASTHYIIVRGPNAPDKPIKIPQ